MNLPITEGVYFSAVLSDGNKLELFSDVDLPDGTKVFMLYVPSSAVALPSLEDLERLHAIVERMIAVRKRG